MIARYLAAVGAFFYLISGGWAFAFPVGFYETVATFSPYNLHLIHDAGAFQLGIGIGLLAAAVLGRGLTAALLGAAAASLLHIAAHVLDIHLGGHPATDLPVLLLMAAILLVALALHVRGQPESSRR